MTFEVSESVSAPVAGQISGSPETSTGVLSVDAPYGVAVCMDPASDSPDGIKLPTSAAEVALLVGILCYRPFRLPDADAAAGCAYKSGREADYLYEGNAWVPVEEAVTRGSQAYVRHTANGTGKLQRGAFRASNDTNTAAACPCTIFDRDSVSVGGVLLARVRTTLPGSYGPTGNTGPQGPTGPTGPGAE